MERIADISFLIGRKFAASSGNICEIRELGPGAIRTYWLMPQTPKDEIEVEGWVVSLAESHHGAEIAKAVCTNPKNEAAMYRKWKDSL